MFGDQTCELGLPAFGESFGRVVLIVGAELGGQEPLGVEQCSGAQAREPPKFIQPGRQNLPRALVGARWGGDDQGLNAALLQLRQGLAYFGRKALDPGLGLRAVPPTEAPDNDIRLAGEHV